MTPPLPRVEIDGRPATPAELAGPALINYGHFTVLQVRDFRTRGLRLHLERLDAAHRELFGAPMPGDRIRAAIRATLREDLPDATVRVTVDASTVLVSAREPAEPATQPRRLLPVAYQRPLAHLKHVGTFGQVHARRLAEAAGYDEALLVDPDGAISEGSVTNLGGYDDRGLIWPDAPLLPGVTMRLLGPGRRVRLRVADLPALRTVFLSNSRGVVPVSEVDGVRLPVDAAIVDALLRTYEAVPWDEI